MRRLDHALALAAIGFHVFPLLPGRKTPPKDMHFKDLATRDQVQIWRWFESSEANVGIYTGKFGDGEALLVVDVDTKKGKNGYEALLRHELEGRDLPATCTQQTPSGGRHYIYRVAAAVRQGADVLGRGLDVRSRGGYIVAAGSVVPAGEYTRSADLLAAAPDWVVAACGTIRESTSKPGTPAVDVNAEHAASRALHYLQHEAPKGEEGGRNDTGFKVAARLKDLGVGRDDCFPLMAEHWRCSPALDDAELRHVINSAFKYGQTNQGADAPEADFTPLAKTSGGVENTAHPFDELNKEFSFVLAGGGSHILWETTDHRALWKLEHLATGAFHAKFAAQKITIGKRPEPVTQAWMEWKGRRSYDGLVFAPQQEAPVRFYNLWRGFAVEPWPDGQNPPQVAQDAVSSFLDHARKNVCREDERLYRWLIGYFAHLVQRPWEKPLVALVFRGGKGVGKNALVERIGALLGNHFLLTSNRRYLVGNFNGHLENCLFFALDEAFWSGDKQAEGTLKDLITGRNHVIEHKGKEPYTVDNRTRVAIIGNEDWLVPASHDERRFAVFDVGEGRKQDRDFFHAMREGMEHGGYRVLLSFLRAYDLAGLDINEAPNTAALLDQKHRTLEPLYQWWIDCLTEGRVLGSDFSGWLTTVECDRLRQAYQRYLRDRNIKGRSYSGIEFGKALKKCCPTIAHTRQRVGGEPVYVYLTPALELARKEWDKYIGASVAWPPV